MRIWNVPTRDSVIDQLGSACASMDTKVPRVTELCVPTLAPVMECAVTSWTCHGDSHLLLVGTDTLYGMVSSTKRVCVILVTPVWTAPRDSVP